MKKLESLSCSIFKKDEITFSAMKLIKGATTHDSGKTYTGDIISSSSCDCLDLGTLDAAIFRPQTTTIR